MWEELNPSNPLDRRCPYCGEVIGIRALFTGEADTDHIIPYSQSLDDSAGNKIIAHRSCNRQKGNKTPYECWGHDDARWETISVQVARMHRSKQWRFGPGARERLDKDGGFLARQLTDTQYLSKTTAKYLSFLYRPDEGRRVYALPGRMTAMLRRVWGLNSLLPDHNYVENAHSNAPKNRLDHRHHIIDGMVAAVTDMGLIRKIATASARAEEKKLDRIFEQLAPPWPSFRDDLKERLTRVTVSHKPDHGRKGRPEKSRDVTGGRLHNDTAYGFTGQVAADGKTPIVVHRIPFAALKPTDIADPLRIPDQALRNALLDATRGLTGKSYEQALARFTTNHPVFKGIRRIRVCEALNVIAIRNKEGRPYKGYKGDSNARYDVWRLPDGKWVADVVSMFDAHHPVVGDRRPHPAAKKVLRLRQNDLLAVERDGETGMLRVVKFSSTGQITLASANEAGPLKARDAAPQDSDPFKYVYSSASGLKKMLARQVRIDPLGRVFDPGPHD